MGDPSKAVLKDILAELEPYMGGLEATVCNESPSPSPPSPAPESYESYSYGDMICQDKCRDSPCQFCLCACNFQRALWSSQGSILVKIPAPPDICRVQQEDRRANGAEDYPEVPATPPIRRICSHSTLERKEDPEHPEQ